MRGCSRWDFLRQTTVTLAMAALASRAARADALTNSPYTAAFIDVSGDELILGGRPLSWWIETFGLPFTSPTRSISRQIFSPTKIYSSGSIPGARSVTPARHRRTQRSFVLPPRRASGSMSPRLTKRAARSRQAFRRKNRRKRQLQGRRSHQPRDQQEHADHCRQHCRARTHRPARQEPSRGAARRVAGNRLSARQSHVSFDFHRGRVEQIRHFHFRHSAALVSPRWNAGEVAWLPHPYRQPNHRSCCLSARAWQAHRARHCTPNGGTEIRGG